MIVKIKRMSGTVQVCEIIMLYYTDTSISHYLPCQQRGRANRISPVRLSVCVCVCVSVSTLTTEPKQCVSIHHGKRTLGRRNFTTRLAGGASRLRHFHYNLFLKIHWSTEVLETQEL